MSADLLKKLYLDEDKTFKEIAKEVKSTVTTIRMNIVRLGFPRRKARIRDTKIVENYLKSTDFNSTYRLRMAMLRLFEHVCQFPNCGYSKFIDCHHIEGKAYWREDNKTKRHTHNLISNAILLCPNHHKEADNGLISKEDLKKVVLKRKIKNFTIKPKRG